MYSFFLYKRKFIYLLYRIFKMSSNEEFDLIGDSDLENIKVHNVQTEDPVETEKSVESEDELMETNKVKTGDGQILQGVDIPPVKTNRDAENLADEPNSRDEMLLVRCIL
jgi:hypothetical protein